MGNTYKVTDTIWYVGVDDHVTDLFEGQYPVLNGMSYNSYVDGSCGKYRAVYGTLSRGGDCQQ